MDAIEFHTGVEDPVGFACRLLRKACRLGVRVLVTAPPGTLVALDRGLWTFEEREFLAHVRVPGAAAAVAARTPIWLAADAGAAQAASAPRVIVNLGAEGPADPAGLERVIEIVSCDPDDAQRGRRRWRTYKAQGLEIRHHASHADPRE